MEKTRKKTEYSSRGGVSIICFLVIIIGQPILLKNILFKNGMSSIPGMYYIELMFCLFMVTGIVVCLVKKDGWGGVKGQSIVFALFVLYCIFTALHYNDFKYAYLNGFNPEFDSAGGALVICKLFLTLIAIIGGIPTAKIDEHEYAQALKEKVQMQEAQWAKDAVKGAKKDLNSTVKKLKQTLTEEELKELMSQLQNETDTSEDEEHSASDDLHGWGGGM